MNEPINSDQDELALFAELLGKFLAQGLNQLNEDKRNLVTAAYRNGGEIFAVCRPEPLSVAGMLQGKNGELVELFKVEEAATWN